MLLLIAGSVVALATGPGKNGRGARSVPSNRGPGLAEVRPASDRAGGPDEYGYVFLDETEPGGPAFAWIDTLGSTVQPIEGDDGRGEVSLPFDFSYYGIRYNTIWVCTNGWFSFGDDPGVSQYSNRRIPDPDDPNQAVFPFWDDLAVGPDYHGNIRTRTVGSAPTRQFVVTWNRVQELGDTGQISFQVVLAERDSSITFQYLDVIVGSPDFDSGASASVGIESHLGLGPTGLEYSYDEPALRNSRAIKFWKRIIPHDVGVVAITSPPSNTPLGAYVPRALVKNFGTQAQPAPFYVKYSASGPVPYADSQLCSALPAGDTTTISFATWNITTAGVYAAKCSTKSGADSVRTNDKAIKTIRCGLPSTGVMIVSTDPLDYMNTLAQFLRDSSAGGFAPVDTFCVSDEGGHATFPATEWFSDGYRALLVYSGGPYMMNGVSVGDSCAKFVELGGGVVNAVWADNDGDNLQGRYRDQYMAFTTQQCIFSGASLGTVHNPGHPIMSGVAALSVDGLYTGNTHYTLRSANCACIAEFDPSPYCLVAAFDSAGMRTASIGYCPTSTQNEHPITGDWVRILVNALQWVMVSGGVEEPGGAQLPASAIALSVSPNPSSIHMAKVNYSLSLAGPVNLGLYDVTGRLLATLANGYHDAGTYCRPPTTGRAQLAAGIYLLRLETGYATATRKLIIE
jgi:hypothetical protein